MEYKSNFKKTEKQLELAMARGLHSLGAFVETEAKVRAAVQTGNLRSSIRFDTDVRDNAVTIGTNVHYAPHVEYGTENMSPQPFLRPAVHENELQIRTVFRRAFERGLF